MTKIQMDLFHDYCDMARHRLRTAGYADVLGESDDDALRRFLNILHRRVPVARRKTHKTNAMSVPVDQQAGFDQLIMTSESGGDLRSYQSTLLQRPAFSDLMLNDWGFQHFHMGVGPHPKIAGFQERTGPLVFAIVTDTDLYCIAIGDHNSFEDRKLLDIVHEEWPDLLPLVLRADAGERLAWEPTQGDIKTLRRHQINSLSTRNDGTINLGRGLGTTMTGGSMRVTMAFTTIVHEVRNWEKTIREEVAANPDNYPAELNLDLILDPNNGWLRAVD